MTLRHGALHQPFLRAGLRSSPTLSLSQNFRILLQGIQLEQERPCRNDQLCPGNIEGKPEGKPAGMQVPTGWHSGYVLRRPHSGTQQWQQEQEAQRYLWDAVSSGLCAENSSVCSLCRVRMPGLRAGPPKEHLQWDKTRQRPCR